MRLRRPVVAATALGLAGAVLPAPGAEAAEPADRHVVFTEDVTYQTDWGTTGYCTVVARLDWVFGEEGDPSDNVLSATTVIQPTYPEHTENDCGGGLPYWMNAAVTLRWTDHGYRRSQTYAYSSEGDVVAKVSSPATPYDTYNDGAGADGVRSEHRASFDDCVANCEWSHTLTFNPK